MLWNVNGWKERKKSIKIKAYLKGLDPVVILLNEPREPLELKNYNSF